jgi:transposase
VIDLATETRPEVLRQVAQLQEVENERLRGRLAALTRELAGLRGQDPQAALQAELALVQAQLAAAQQRLYGRSSERRAPEAAPGDAARAAKTPQTGHGPRVQPTLPVVEVGHALDAADRVCTACGGALTEMTGQSEDSEEIDVVAASYRVLRHRRTKYRCGCGGCVETALGPPKLVPGGRYSIDFAVSVAVAKYLDHLPLARQVRQMARAGLAIDTQTLWDQLAALARHLEPTYQGLHDYVLTAPVLGADETTWRLLEKPKGKTWYAWSAVREDAVVYRIDASRSAEAAKQLLRDYPGVVMCDGYAAYGTLARARDGPGGFRLAHCWSHVRRKFLEAEPDFPVAKELLDRVTALYAIEAETRGAADARRARRATESKAVIGEIHAWLLAQRALPQSSLGKALAYTAELWPGLVRFPDDPAIPLDNNATERALRGVVLGRKNHYGSKSQRGTEVAALFYSLLESAKLAGQEPAAYLAAATRRAVEKPGAVTLPRDLTSA